MSDHIVLMIINTILMSDLQHCNSCFIFILHYRTWFIRQEKFYHYRRLSYQYLAIEFTSEQRHCIIYDHMVYIIEVIVPCMKI